MRPTWLVALVLVALAVVAGFEDVAAQQKWKAVATSRPTPQFALWTWLGEELDKRTNGQVKLEVVSLPEIGLTGFELVRVTRASSTCPTSSCRTSPVTSPSSKASTSRACSRTSTPR